MIASHIIWSCYGFWLPNDPAGSWSDFVRRWELLRFGPATKVNTRRALDRPVTGLRQAAKAALKYPPVRLTGEQARSVARGIRHAIDEAQYILHGLAILRDHVHAVVGRHERPAERIRDHFKARATRQMNTDGVNPMGAFAANPSPWSRGGWIVYLNTVEQVDRAVRYVFENPQRENLPAQSWAFITPFSGGRQPALVERKRGMNAPAKRGAQRGDV